MNDIQEGSDTQSLLADSCVDSCDLGVSEAEVCQPATLALDQIGEQGELDNEDDANWQRFQQILAEKSISADSPDLVDKLRERGFDDAFISKVAKQLGAVAGPSGSVTTAGEAGSTADHLVELALERYRIGRTETDDAFAVEMNGPNLALMFRGSREALRSALARNFRKEHGRVPNSAALADALTVLQGEAYEADPEPVYLRVAEHEGKIVIDLGDASGRAVIVEPGKWEVADRSPVLFRRTAATGTLPTPEQGGSLEKLREILNMTAETWPLARGWLVASFMPKIPHPILLLGGQQGAGKTTAAKQFVGVLDPSPAAVRSHPRDIETWAITAAGSWVVAVDNISTIPEWWSDSLCKAVTGDGWLRRKLFTDGELAVLTFRRVIMLTSIDPGALRGDLGDRVLLVDLEPIAESKRLAEQDLVATYESARPRIFGAVLDLLAQVLEELPKVQLDRLPRMADFAKVLAAMDNVSGDYGNESALKIYLSQRERIAETVIESDEVALAVQKLVDEQGNWEGTAAELKAEITPETAPKGWPGTPRALSGRLKRLTPALEQVGIIVGKMPRSGKRRPLSLHRKEPDQTVTTDTPSPILKNSELFNGEFVTNGDDGSQPTAIVTDIVTQGTWENATTNGFHDGGDGDDEAAEPLSEWGEV